ncbi:Sodium/potassium/calcium exchanger [Seminavis robusta]|uniref:Sodium/potassium/calcium exchanger n=1 Tax=Seminavis robusta TaxID=568900 RepID=A0A9N8DCD5_9STRA|nr:Sodium/potassium/calcium exchanger [Seminavis robusta]|eukprot:Sro83_g044260.1 Sodium/potassium/calcium exchanger (638) ;mRNA; r:31807-34525
MDEDEVPTAPVWVWIVLSLIAVVSFWCQATVTEERFVPALNVIAYEYNIPNDIAGATLMAAGASSPELFSSFVALFITHSALGLGTIVGSEIFNQLIICAGAVFASSSGRLQLDKPIVLREVGFYGLSIGLLYFALNDRRPSDDDELGEDHIFINFLDACILFGGYIAYVLVCANMDAIVALFSGTSRAPPADSDNKANYGAVEGLARPVSFNLPDMPFMRETFGHEPVANFADSKQAFLRTPGGLAVNDSQRGSFSSIPESLRRFSDGRSLRQFFFSVRDDKPSDEHGLHDIEFNAKEGRISCFMWQRSFFYNKARYGTNGWHLRWFSFTKDGMKSVPDRVEFKKHGLKYPKFTQIEFDDKRHIIRIENPAHCKRREFFFMTPSDEVFDAVVDKMQGLVKHWNSEEDKAEEGTAAGDSEAEDEFEDSDPHVDMTEFPADASILGVAFFVFLFPLRFIMQWTIGDVRTLDKEGNPTATLGKAYLAAFMCLVWLIIGSYAMVSSLEHLADLMDIPKSVVGVTVSAAGTSLPNYVASKVAAQKGFGNMAVSNAFGSNTFNIMVGLGLPWVLYIASNGFEPYHGLHDDGITMSVIILGTVLALFVVLVFPFGFVIYRWHGFLFILLYVAYLAYAIGQVYL